MDYTVSTIDKIDERFDFNNTTQYIKSIQVSLDGFSYIVTNPDDGTHLALRDYNFGTDLSLSRIEEITSDLFNNEDILSGHNQKINIAFTTRPWAMVPAMLFNEGNITKILDINFKPDEFTKTTYCKIPGSKIVLASRIPVKIAQILENHSSNLNFIPHQAAFIFNALQTLKHNVSDSALFMAVHGRFFDLAYIQNNEVIFYNNFAYTQYDDVLYFALSAMERLEIRSDEAHIFIQGNDLVKEIIPQEIKKYIRHVYIDNQLYNERYSYQFDQLPLYKYKLLTGIFRCGS